jgi:two-component system, chemotaxis family, protein-glutamate methylesterase/glutaminase
MPGTPRRSRKRPAARRAARARRDPRPPRHPRAEAAQTNAVLKRIRWRANRGDPGDRNGPTPSRDGATHYRDTIVIGASAGGVEAITRLLSQLPADLRASVCVVQHQSGGQPGRLAEILGRESPLPVHWARNEDVILNGHVYLAPPDRHLLVSDSHLVVSEGPHENRVRPSINPLFRSAATSRSSRTIGVLLTGMLDDGVAGLRAIQRCGGATIVQSPQDAEFPDMPRNALGAMRPTAVVPLHRMGRTIVNLVSQRVHEVDVPPAIALEAKLAGTAATDFNDVETLGRLVPLSCPECGGPLWAMDEDYTRYRCHVGHAYTARSLLVAQEEDVERSLWAAVRALQHRSSTFESLAVRAGEHDQPAMMKLYQARAQEARMHSDRARRFLLAVQEAEHKAPKK